MDKERVLKIRDLSISFKTENGKIEAIRGVRLDLFKGETLAIVGESGSGKSVTTKAIMGNISSNGKIESGKIEFSYDKNNDNNIVVEDIVKLSKKEINQNICGKRIAMVFQDPMTSLNPTLTIGKQVIEAMRYHYKVNKKDAFEKAVSLLEEVGIVDARKRMKNYPHQLSGGMRQRVVIAIALSCEPEVLICDEPTTALDVTIQAKILDLIKKIQKQRNISVIYITHDLGVVATVADYVAVMYAGKIIEKGSIKDIFYYPKHPYTWGLLSAMPDIDVDDDELYTIPGTPPNLCEKIEGEAFAPRNQFALNIDYRLESPLMNVGGKHRVASWLYHKNAPDIQMPKTLQKRLEKMRQEAGING